MRILAVGARKGGAGKTTVAVNLLLAARAAGLRAALADADPLRSAREALRGVEVGAELVLETSPRKLFALANACRREGLDLLVLDTPAIPDDALGEAAAISDLTLLVARPSFLDLAATAAALQDLKRLQRPHLVVLNHCAATRVGREPPQVLKAIAAMEFAGAPLAAQRVRNRAAYQAGVLAGHSNPSSCDPAVLEMRALLAEIRERIDGEAAQGQGVRAPFVKRSADPQIG